MPPTQLFIRANAEGTILGFAEYYADCPNSQRFTGTVPEDFAFTAGLGKYKFIKGEIIAVEGWVPPEPPAPLDAPTLQEIQELPDDTL